MSEPSEPYAPPKAKRLDRRPLALSNHEAAIRLAHKLATYYLSVGLFVVAGSALTTVAGITTIGPVGYTLAAVLIVVGGAVLLVIALFFVLAGVAVEWTRGSRLRACAVGLLGLLSGGLLILPFLLFVPRAGPEEMDAR